MEDNKIKKFISANLGYIAVLLMCALYIAMSLLYIDEKGKTIKNIIEDGVLSFLFGVSINTFFRMQGIILGSNDPRLMSASKQHGEIVERIVPYFEYINDWCDIENKKNLKRQRTKILARAGMKYGDFFDEDGVAKPFQEKVNMSVFTRVFVFFFGSSDQKNRISRYKAYRKAVNLKLTLLTPHDLTNDGGRADDPFYSGRSKAQYNANQTTSDVITKFIISIVIGYWSVKWFKEIDYAALLWNAFQTVLFIVFGTISKIKAKLYMTDEYRCRIVMKTDNLQMFENYMKKGENKNGKDENSVGTAEKI